MLTALKALTITALCLTLGSILAACGSKHAADTPTPSLPGMESGPLRPEGRSRSSLAFNVDQKMLKVLGIVEQPLIKWRLWTFEPSRAG